MPRAVMFARGASWMMFPTRNYSGCQRMEEVGTGLTTEQWVSVPEASWKSTWLLVGAGFGRGGGGGLRQETVEGTEEEARHLLQRMLRPWARRERSSRQLHCSGENGFRSGRWRKVSESVTGDTTEGRWSRWNRQWIRKPHKWLLLLELDCVLPDKTQLSYIPCVKRQTLDKMSSKDPSN